jgi:predicted RND superfamily exporter protein
MRQKWFRWWWAILLVPVIAGLFRLHFDADVLSLLPANIPEVQGLKLYQQHFSNSRELIITVKAPSAEAAKTAAESITSHLRQQTNLVADATSRPPWMEHPELMTELIAYLWLNQPPAVFHRLAENLSVMNLTNVVAATRDQLSTTLSPQDLAQLSYDPYGFTQLPPDVTSAAPSFGQGEGMFASADGTFRIIFVKASADLAGYRECTDWLNSVKAVAENSADHVRLGYTGRPAFVVEISSSMKHDVILSVGGTAFIIATLFWLAHRRWKPMLWLLTLLALILVGTLALGSLLLGAINVISMGFAAILLGLAVDYAVVHYQEALSYPILTVPEIRRAIAPSIFWAAMTTICAFLVLNFGGLPGLGQLGSLVGIGVALSALVMIMAYLPPLFPDRMSRPAGEPPRKFEPPLPEKLDPSRAKTVFVLTALLILAASGILAFGWPKIDASTRAMEPRHSEAYAALDAIKQNLSQNQEPLWVVVTGPDESAVAKRLSSLKPALDNAVKKHLLTGYTLPDALWPRPENQTANRAAARQLIAEEPEMQKAALSGGFTADAVGLNAKIFQTWRGALATTNVFWPSNRASQWIFEKIAAHNPGEYFAAAFLYPTGESVGAEAFTAAGVPLPSEGVWLSSWSLLGHAVLAEVKNNMWKVIVPMISLVLLSLWLAFGRMTEIFLSLGTLAVSGLCLLAVMRIFGWSWNVLNLMALPLILGTGVDYSLFMQLALRRYGGSLIAARQSVGRALLLCGGTAVAGFGSLGLSSNAGMSSLGQVCATGLAGNMLISIFLLPVWWKKLADRKQGPSQLYHGFTWKAGMALGRHMPSPLGHGLAKIGAAIYWHLAKHRRQIVVQNLLPALNGDLNSATRAARLLFTEFALKVVDLWRYEAGVTLDNFVMDWKGWEVYLAAHARGCGVLLVTPHLGNWEIGGAHVPLKGFKLVVLTQPEPDPRLTQIRQSARALRGVETIVVGEDAFAFIEIIKRLQAGETVALLMDRPAAATAVTVELFGRPFSATIAAAELARASGCAILPGCIVRTDKGYSGEIRSEIFYDRAQIGNRQARIQLTQEIMREFEPSIKKHINQWFHFVPIWPRD